MPEISIEQYHAIQAHEMPEKDLQEEVRKAADTFGWKFFHPFWMQRSSTGWPDCTLVRDGRIIFVELKSEDKEPTIAQQTWLDALAETGAEVYVWRPSDLRSGRIDEVLR